MSPEIKIGGDIMYQQNTKVEMANSKNNRRRVNRFNRRKIIVGSHSRLAIPLLYSDRSGKRRKPADE